MVVKRLSLGIVFIYVNHLRFITLDSRYYCCCCPLIVLTNLAWPTKPTLNWKNWHHNTATTTATAAASLTGTSPGNLLEFKVASFYWFW